MRGRLEIDDEHGHGQQDQYYARSIDRQVEQRHPGQDAGNYAHHPRQEEPGMGHPEPDGDDGQQQEEVGDVRVRDRLQQAVELAQLDALDGGVGCVQRVCLAALVHLPAVQVFQQAAQVATLQVDDVELERL